MRGENNMRNWAFKIFLHTSKNSIVREALEEWINRHNLHSSWPPHFFDFEPIKEVPHFSAYRKELIPPKENIF